MAVYGSDLYGYNTGSTWTLTRNKIIKRAYRLIGVIATGQELTSQQLQDGIEAFEGLLKSLGDEGIQLYKIDWFIANLISSDEIIGSDLKNYKCYRSHISSSSNYPITGEQYKAFWREEGSSGLAWQSNEEYNSINNIILPSDIINILKVFYRDSANNDTPVELISREDYADICSKSDTSNFPAAVWHNKAENQLYLWPIPTTINDYTVHIHAQKIIDDLVNPNSIPDVKTSMYEMLAFGLAYKLSFENVIPLDERNFLNTEYEKLKFWKKTNNTEDQEINYKRGAY